MGNPLEEGLRRLVFAVGAVDSSFPRMGNPLEEGLRLLDNFQDCVHLKYPEWVIH